MRHTLWTLLFALLLQLVPGSVWALAQTSGHPVHCHETVTESTSVGMHHANAQQDKAHPASLQADGHHCCAVGLGVGVQALLQPLPQAAPASPTGHWASLSVRPDLPPPI